VSRAPVARTQELILRYAANDKLEILDVGGGPGIYAKWLAELGHDVRLVDPVSLHVEQARSAGVNASEGDAPALDQPSGSIDVVLLLGPSCAPSPATPSMLGASVSRSSAGPRSGGSATQQVDGGVRLSVPPE
jgi:SAM-dependent methyltransferase